MKCLYIYKITQNTTIHTDCHNKLLPPIQKFFIHIQQHNSNENRQVIFVIVVCIPVGEESPKKPWLCICYLSVGWTRIQQKHRIGIPKLYEYSMGLLEILSANMLLMFVTLVSLLMLWLEYSRRNSLIPWLFISTWPGMKSGKCPKIMWQWKFDKICHNARHQWYTSDYDPFTDSALLHHHATSV